MTRSHHVVEEWLWYSWIGWRAIEDPCLLCVTGRFQGGAFLMNHHPQLRLSTTTHGLRDAGMAFEL